MLRKSVLSVVVFVSMALAAAAQTVPFLAQYSWAPVTTMGPVGMVGTDQFLNLSNPHTNVPVFHTISYTVSGTLPTSCTFRVEGTLDFVNWQGLDVTAPATESCTASGMFHIPYKPVRGIRVNVVSYTAGDTTTSVVFSYTGSN